MFKLFLLSLLLFSFSVPIVAAELSIGGGAVYSFIDIEDDEQLDVDNTFSLQVGALIKSKLNESLHLRTGAFITKRNLKFKTDDGTNIKIKGSLDYLSFPLTLEYKLPDGGLNIVTGVNLQFNVGDDCEVEGSGSCEFSDVEDLVTPLVFGMSKELTDKLIGEVMYEHALGESAEELKISSLVLNFMYKI